MKLMYWWITTLNNKFFDIVFQAKNVNQIKFYDSIILFNADWHDYTENNILFVLFSYNFNLFIHSNLLWLLFGQFLSIKKALLCTFPVRFFNAETEMNKSWINLKNC